MDWQMKNYWNNGMWFGVDHCLFQDGYDPCDLEVRGQSTEVKTKTRKTNNKIQYKVSIAINQRNQSIWINQQMQIKVQSSKYEPEPLVGALSPPEDLNI